MDLLVDVDVEGSLDKGQCHLKSFNAELGTVICDELQSLNSHQSAIARGILLKILLGEDREIRDKEKRNGEKEEREEELSDKDHLIRESLKCMGKAAEIMKAVMFLIYVKMPYLNKQ